MASTELTEFYSRRKNETQIRKYIRDVFTMGRRCVVNKVDAPFRVLSSNRSKSKYGEWRDFRKGRATWKNDEQPVDSQRRSKIEAPLRWHARSRRGVIRLIARPIT